MALTEESAVMKKDAAQIAADPSKAAVTTLVKMLGMLMFILHSYLSNQEIRQHIFVCLHIH